MDAQDDLFYRVDAATARCWAATPLPRRACRPRTRAAFYQDDGARPAGAHDRRAHADRRAAGAPLVQVQVAETLHKRTGSALEMMATVVLPQLAADRDGHRRWCGSASRAGCSRCSGCALRCPTARTWT
jgi:two-component system sensor histidine kinase TctE